MKTDCQCGKFQEESMHFEHKKHDGFYPIIGVNAFLNPHGSGVATEIELARSTEDEKQSQLKRLKAFQTRNAGQAEASLAKLRQAVIDNGNVFVVKMEAVRHCSLGQDAEGPGGGGNIGIGFRIFMVVSGRGPYRRSM